ncbi:MAG: hypothetical protein KGD63_00285, partial [Candidatus Lokiarchaeota archaeon]|nr:hypothetical protein [Candidatus Lokiarchaeota archaeon]
QTKGYFSSGNHTIESWISSYDSLSGSQLDTWLSIRLIIQYEDTIEEKINPEEEEEEIDTEEKDEEDISCKIEKKRKKKYRPHNSDKYRRRKRMRCFHTFSTKNPYYFLN